VNVAPIGIGASGQILGLTRKTTLPAVCDEGVAPALASLGFYDVNSGLSQYYLVVGYRHDETDILQFQSSTDDGVSFGNYHFSAERTDSAPSMVEIRFGRQPHMLVAWKGEGNENLNVGVVNLAGVSRLIPV
jgi:hypothetical protein